MVCSLSYAGLDSTGSDQPNIGKMTAIPGYWLMINVNLPRLPRGISFSFCSSGNRGGLINKKAGREGSGSAVLESLSFCPSVPLARIVKTMKAPNSGGHYNAVSEAPEYTHKVY